MTAPPRSSTAAETASFHAAVLGWFDTYARVLPWRGEASPWAIMVSEFMLQQTPVVRVLPVFADWMHRWPTPADLAGSAPGDAVRAWGRLGYPRRALRLHGAATTIVTDHDGEVPTDHQALLALPGVGAYTAAAIGSFAFGQRHVVLDTNVRRLFARVCGGVEFAPAAPTAAERTTGLELLPAGPDAARWAAATMELGALICTSRSPRCEVCPVAHLCRWRAAGYPPYDGPKRRAQTYEGTDRQCRGRILQLLREADGSVSMSAIDAIWDEAEQRERALASLLTDGLVEDLGSDSFALPGQRCPTQR